MVYIGNDLKTVASAVANKYGGKPAEWQTKINMIYPVYRDMIMKGVIEPFTLRSGKPQTTAKLIAEQVSYSAREVLNYLATLEELTKAGKISGEWYNPKKHIEILEEKKVFQETVKKASPKKPSIFTPFKAPAQEFGKAVNKGISSGLTFGILALTGYLIFNLNKRNS